jgi:hypothetical protein
MFNKYIIIKLHVIIENWEAKMNFKMCEGFYQNEMEEFKDCGPVITKERERLKKLISDLSVEYSNSAIKEKETAVVEAVHLHEMASHNRGLVTNALSEEARNYDSIGTRANTLCWGGRSPELSRTCVVKEQKKSQSKTKSLEERMEESVQAFEQSQDAINKAEYELAALMKNVDLAKQLTEQIEIVNELQDNFVRVSGEQNSDSIEQFELTLG